MTIHYCDFNSILLVNSDGKLRQMFTPFTVVARPQTNCAGQKYVVSEVRTTAQDELVFCINDKFYYYHQFDIELNF